LVFVVYSLMSYRPSSRSLGFMGLGLWFGSWGSGFRVWGFRIGVGVSGLRFGVWGLGLSDLGRVLGGGGEVRMSEVPL